MADQVRQPVAVRVMRPYSSEEAFLEHEIETLTRTSIVLVGAQPRPQGVVLRFEVVLETGTSLLRGEGRVVNHKPNAFGDQPGLTLRFTRLDTRSKALVDKAAAIRDARARAALDAAGSQAPPPPVNGRAPSVRPMPASIPRDLTPPPASVATAPRPPTAPPPPAPPPPPATDLARTVEASFVPPPQPSEPILVASTGEIDAATVERAKSVAESLDRSDRTRELAKSLGAVPDREAVLTRLRERRREMSAGRVDEIFSLKRRS